MSLAPQRGAAITAAPRPRPSVNPSRVATVRLATGVVLPYVERGDRGGVPVVFLHGVTDSWRSFEPVLPLLPASIHAFAVTQRGHGDAIRPNAGYRVSDFAADLEAFLDAVGIDAAVIVGHSMGSVVAQRFAIDHPDRTRGVVLAGTFWAMCGNPGIEELWTSTLATLTDPVPPTFVREFQESTLARPIDPAFVDMVVAESLKVPARVWRETFAGFRRDDFRAELGAITASTLIVWGERDTFCPWSDQEQLAAAIPCARLVTYEAAGHAMHWEEPERFARDVARFIADTSEPADAPCALATSGVGP